MQEILNPAGSWKNYRDLISKVRGACLPYLGVYLHDLTFAEENQNSVPDPSDSTKSFINFAKCEVLYNIISQFELFQQMPYDFPIVEPIHTFLLELPSLSDKDLYNLSLKLEPKIPSHETLTPSNSTAPTVAEPSRSKSPFTKRGNGTLFRNPQKKVRAQRSGTFS